jgi:hypothetical protein
MELSGSFTPRPLYPHGKSPWYPLDRRLHGPQSQSGRGGEEKNSQPLPGLEPPITQPIVKGYTTELSWLVPSLRMRGAVPRLPQYFFMAWCLVKHRDNLTFNFTFNFNFTFTFTFMCNTEGGSEGNKHRLAVCSIDIPKCLGS